MYVLRHSVKISFSNVILFGVTYAIIFEPLSSTTVPGFSDLLTLGPDTFARELERNLSFGR